MIGTAVVSLPWAYQESGLVLGVIITITSFLVSFYTCKLIVDCTGDDPDYSDTLKKYYGKSQNALTGCRQVGFLHGLDLPSNFDCWRRGRLLCHYDLGTVPMLAGHICLVLW